jgi:choline dehydrogenase-like flavoprotein
MRRLRLDWRLNDLDGLTFASALKLIGRETGRQRIGRFWLRPPFRGLDLDRPESIRFDIPILAPPSVHNQLDTELRWGCHHMGTTRMHVDPRYGVVDEHARVHGLCNLYIAGSSVFPSAGLSNPTLTILALVFRLADHLRKLG